MASPLAGKTAVVTGGSRGIGLEWVSQLLAAGCAKVVATARDPAGSSGLSELAKSAGDRLLLAKLEASSPDSIKALPAELKAAGIDHVDLLINNAGMAKETFEHGVADLEAASFAEVMSVNALGPMLVVQQLLAAGQLGGATPSTVVHISSIMASMGGFAFPQARMLVYRASKAALNMLALASVGELTPRNVTSVLMHPGYVATDMTKGHSGTISPEDSVTGQLKVITDGRGLNGKFFSYDGAELAF